MEEVEVEVEVDEDYNSTRHKLSGPISEEDVDPSDLTCITPASVPLAATSVMPTPMLSAAAMAGSDPRIVLMGADRAILAYATTAWHEACATYIVLVPIVDGR